MDGSTEATKEHVGKADHRALELDKGTHYVTNKGAP